MLERAAEQVIGHRLLGHGSLAVVVMNDWLCDTSTWDGVQAFLDTDQLTWAFTDLRGYGLSRGVAGEHTVEEAAADVVAVADQHGWTQFAVVGHSMSALVALHLAQQQPDRVTRTVLLTPPPPGGFGADDEGVAYMRSLAGDETARQANVQQRLGHVSVSWARWKADRWRTTSDPEAVAGYTTMFAQRGLPDQVTRITCPVLAVTGELDVEPMRNVAVSAALAPLCKDLQVVALAESGHYPMQEAPPVLVGLLERFLTA